jgi:hypothetical protein
MERGLYEWDKQPLNSDGSYRVVKHQILKDCGVTGQYAGAAKRIWGSEEFRTALEKENRRRDIGVASAVAEIEAIKGPLTLMGDKILDNVDEVFSRKPDKEDPQALSPAEYVRLGREWFHEALEVEGKMSSVKQQSIAEVMEKLSDGNQVTQQMLDTAMDLLHEHRAMQDIKLAKVGTVEVLDG